ncbi:MULTISPECIES: helix-turn-helix domain-containing protein [Rhizobium]|uniref:HTH-type transcriptional regulator/antitoxin HigA n=1 Tax=Rhizobium paranaense TaxID=1650438 RepID=A0A7W8XQG8_9HYPH|nr:MULTISPECIES: XRE family transcriptional regulator [Rhizobium]MBB5573414.1 HTH-type transcriptional regulator/antitoxin HigA [Rhizobium paranaense]PST62949.1 XRE family transcriptional regulator [Rhizobium sp. SEMIA4064]
MRDIKPIKTDADLEWALAEIAPYFDNPPEDGTAEADRFDVLTDLIEAYENRHFTVEDPEPVELLRAFMEMTGRSQSDLAELLGSRSRASEILGRKRALTLDMIFKLKEEWGIPADCLVRPYALVA